ncbi:hypothetical protein JZ751_029657 [Albula glossodonta]|uniref:RING-type E3 ubiquitin transferase n=1 Tax=Albula glossodonta TaxID=121402 RepID=A0A8T2NLA7_9TELE|nr:hypothetical protein JZ751_029657 [Albula glossodonta]
MQCILTRVDFDLYYGGEAFSVEQPQSFTCPYCGKMGYTETSLQEHVSSEHAETSTEVICPICAALPGGDPNHDESSGVRHVRRMFHPGRGLGGPRARRSNMHFTSSSTGGLTNANPAPSDNAPPTSHNSQFLLTRLNEPKMCETERQALESERADRSLFVQELLLSTLVREESSSSDEDERREFADFGAMGCVDIMPLDVALENLNLKEGTRSKDPPSPPL